MNDNPTVYCYDFIKFNREQKIFNDGLALINSLDEIDIIKVLNNTRTEIKALDNSKKHGKSIEGLKFYKTLASMKLFYKDELIYEGESNILTQTSFSKNEILRNDSLTVSELFVVAENDINIQNLIKNDLNNSYNKKKEELKSYKKLVLIDNEISKKRKELLDLKDERNKILAEIQVENPDFFNNTNEKSKEKRLTNC